MPDDISAQILSQTSDNIQQLFDLSTRIDERVKTIQNKQEDLDKQVSAVIAEHNLILQKMAVIESHKIEPVISSMKRKISETNKTVNDMDKRLINVERSTMTTEDRWGKFSSFIIQLIWIVIAAWVLLKLNLNSPPVP